METYCLANNGFNRTTEITLEKISQLVVMHEMEITSEERVHVVSFYFLITADVGSLISDQLG